MEDNNSLQRGKWAEKEEEEHERENQELDGREEEKKEAGRLGTIQRRIGQRWIKRSP